MKKTYLLIAAAIVVAPLTGCVSPGEEHGASSSLGSPVSAPRSTTCDVRVLASDLAYPSQLVYAAGSLYVVSGKYMEPGVITRVPLSGDPPTTLLNEAAEIAADASYVYWISGDSSLKRMPVGGGAPTVVLPPGKDLIGPLAIDSNFLYAAWSNSSIVRMPIAGGNVETLYQGPDASQVTAFAVDATNLYWANNSTDVFWDARLMKVPLAGGPATKLIGFRGPARELALFDGAVYVADNGTSGTQNSAGAPTGNGSVLRVPIDGNGSASLIDGGQAWVNGVAADSSGIYWGGGLIGFSVGPDPSDVEGTGVMRVAANGLLETVAPGVLSWDVAACDGGICWTDRAAGKVMRAVCSPNPPGSDVAPSSGPNAGACDAFCGSVGNCARLDCQSVCAQLVGGPCSSRGTALAQCLARQLDPLVCQASGCDAETAALRACRSTSTSACAGAPGGTGGSSSADGAVSSCQSTTYCKGVEQRAVCDTESGTTTCTCYVNLTPVGTCSAAVTPAPLGGPQRDCTANACCDAAFASVSG